MKVAWVVLLLVLAGCARESPYVREAPDRGRVVIACPGEASPEPEFTELSPGLRLDAERGVVEFDAEVAIDAHDPRTPDVYLELIACTPDTREHESLVVTRVRPSLIHAALLAAGLEPGAPGAVRMLADATVQRRAATGDPVRVEFLVGDGPPQDPAAWVVEHGGERVLAESPRWRGLVFAGSRVVERGGRAWYDADGAGTLIGLTTFGGEVIGPVWAVSPESAIDAPVWVARGSVVPGRGVRVRVRVRGESSRAGKQQSSK